MFQTTNQIYIYIHIIPEILVLHQGIALANIPKNMCVCVYRSLIGGFNLPLSNRLGGHGIPKDFADEGWPVGAHQGGIGIAPLGHVNSLARFPEAF